MSLRFLSSLNSPPIVTAAGVAIAAVFPLIPTGAWSLGLLQACNVLAFCTNVGAVTVPGRIDGSQQTKMQTGNLNPAPETTNLLTEEQRDKPVILRERTLLRPAGWAFAIWAPIYVGEATFCVAQFVDPSLSTLIPQVTAPFVAASLLQALWCASFRPSYNQGWHKYVSFAMLGGTAFALSQIPADLSWYFLPMVMHFGWTTAATLVNFNGSLAMSSEVSDFSVISAGHASAVAATAMGVGVTVFELSTPVYGLTVAWALAAVAKGISVETHEHHWSDSMQTGARVQRALCLTGSILCATAAAFSYFIEY